MVTIALRALPEYTLEATLDDVPYQLTVKWNTRAAQYTMDIATRDNVVLISGLGLALNSDLVRSHAASGLPSGGGFALIDPSGGWQDVVFDDLERRCQLIFLTEAEYAAL